MKTHAEDFEEWSGSIELDNVVVSPYGERLFDEVGRVGEAAKRHLANLGWVKPVRCRECRHSVTPGPEPPYLFCAYWGLDADPDDWCSKGERRDG